MNKHFKWLNEGGLSFGTKSLEIMQKLLPVVKDYLNNNCIYGNEEKISKIVEEYKLCEDKGYNL